MKIAVILVGHIRTWEKTKDSFIKAFGKFNPDVFVTTYDKKYGFAPYIRDLTKYYEEEDISEEQLRSMFDGINLINMTVDKMTDMDAHIEQIKSDIKIEYENIASFYPQFLKLKREFDVLAAYEEKNNFKYDVIIKTRTDLAYKEFNAELSPNNIIVDRGNVFPNDVIFMSMRDNMEKVINFLPNEFMNPIYPEESGRWPPHSILFASCKNAGLRIDTAEIVDYVARMNLNQKY
jgi:hypothetical protein